MKKKGFTLIELIAVLVILAILALIVTPLVMNIIRKARISADKRSIDAYGRSIEYAIATYLLDNGKFPTSIEELTIEYTGDRVLCSTTQLNSDSTVYLAGCTVGGRSVDYTYGIDKSPSYTVYSIGDEVTYNGANYYVLKDSGAKKTTVTLLKAEPLTVEEMNIPYGGDGTVNFRRCIGQYGIGIPPHAGIYDNSTVKEYIEQWSSNYLNSDDLVEDETGYSVRLITIDELIENLGYTYVEEGTSMVWRSGESTPTWIWNNEYKYWTMSAWEDSDDNVWVVSSRNNGQYGIAINEAAATCSYGNYVRPVINLLKSAIN